ncbi:MAG TPA: 30S ribosomal protein S17e [Candidatus Nanoarchaeia archaeon]|jgi:small subunit ribosomal protein S17e|nr:30S ribosomal protein S17e [Candidatus Nanoarchaeia archaeon]
MGRIKTALIKRITLELVDKHKKAFTADFEQNKPLVAKRTDIRSKKIRNIVAGYVTRIIRANKD